MISVNEPKQIGKEALFYSFGFLFVGEPTKLLLPLQILTLILHSWR
jgi:hypothetical protein